MMLTLVLDGPTVATLAMALEDKARSIAFDLAKFSKYLEEAILADETERVSRYRQLSELYRDKLDTVKKAHAAIYEGQKYEVHFEQFLDDSISWGWKEGSK